VLRQQSFKGVLTSPCSLLALRSKALMSNLTISLLISRDVDCSGDICCNDINEGLGAACGFRPPSVVREWIVIQPVRLDPRSPEGE